MSHVPRVRLDQHYKSSSVCFGTESHLLLPFNIPLNRPVNVAALTLWLL